MNSFIRFAQGCLTAAVFLNCSFSWAAIALPSAPLRDIEARVIVKFKPNSNTVRKQALSARQMQQPGEAAIVLQQRALALGTRHNKSLKAGRGISEHMQVVVAKGIDSATLARVLAADKELEYAVVDQKKRRFAIPNDPLYKPTAGTSPASGQWYLKSPQDPTGTVSSIDAPSAWNFTTGSTNIVIAVLDTGVRLDHIDLNGKFLAGRDMVDNPVVSGDQTATGNHSRDSDASDPGDYVSEQDRQDNSIFSNCSVENSSWHGTMVSGLVGALSNNSIGMTGMSWNSKILPVRVLGKCFGYDSDIIAGMRWAAGLPVAGVAGNSNPAKVMNLSLGGADACSTAYNDAIGEIIAAGSVIVVAAGNEGATVDAPANCPGVIAVTALRHTGTKVGFANLGAEVTLAAPGGNCVNTTGECLYPMLSTTNSGTQQPVAGAAGSAYTDGFNYGVGTSFSAPLVSGTVALMFAANPSLTPSQVTTLLKRSARDFVVPNPDGGTPVCVPPNGRAQLECFCTTGTCGAGMLDAGAAVRAAATAGGATGPLTAHIDASPRVPSPGDVVTLSAAGTQLDAGRHVASHEWVLRDGGGIAPGFTGASNAATATLQPSGPGSFSVQLTVVDDLGATSTQQLTVQVDALSVEVLVTPAAATAGQAVTLRADQLQLSPGRSVAAYGWLLVSGGAGVSALDGNLNGDTLTVTPTSAGSFVVRLTVTDDLGKQAVADATVTVTGSATQPPSSSAAPADGGGGAASMLWQMGLAIGMLSLLPMRRRVH